MFLATELEIAWAAGLFEGEGCISVHERSDDSRPTVSLSLTTTDGDVMERFVRVVGYGSIFVHNRPDRPAHDKPHFRWQIGNARQVERVIGLLLPLLGERRTTKANEALKIASGIKSTKGPARLKVCRKGHALSGHNLKISRRGKRRCRACLNAWRRVNEKAAA